MQVTEWEKMPGTHTTQERLCQFGFPRKAEPEKKTQVQERVLHFTKIQVNNIDSHPRKVRS